MQFPDRPLSDLRAAPPLSRRANRRGSGRCQARLLAWLVASAGALAGCGGGTTSADEAAVARPQSAATASRAADQAVAEVTGPGELKSATRIGLVRAIDIRAAVQAEDTLVAQVAPVYEVASYRLTYLTSDGQGKPVVASGLISLPIKFPGARSPVISYQHGTIFKDAQAPSNHAVASEPTLIMASLGYIVVAADYVGYGASKGVQHPYLLAEPAAAAVVDLLTAARTWRQRNGVTDNGQLYLLGYSEGGHATAAAHRALQAGNSVHKAQLVGSAPGAGPLHVTLTLDAALTRVREANWLLGALIKPGFLSHLGSSVRNEVRRQMLNALIPDDADVSFQSTFLDLYLADDSGGLDRQCNVHDWTPATPLRLFHGRADQTVPYVASRFALQTMQARGAGQVSLTDCPAAPSSHLGCVAPYFAFALGQLAGSARDL